MADAPEGPAPEPLSVGWARLADAEWEAARDLFTDALGREETPEAFEGLSWAAWWLDDGETVFDARKRAYLLYLRRGERASAARMATWLAADQLDFRGAVAVASGSLRRARRLLDAVEPGPDHGWLAFHEGYIAHLSGDTTKGALGAEAAEAGRRFEVPDLEMLGLPLRGAVLVGCAQVEEGMRYSTSTGFFAQLRDRLVPYLAEEMERGINDARPLMRPLCFDRPHDPEVWRHPLHYMLGRHLLVAPITEPGATEWTVYLPEGEWADAWTGDGVEAGEVRTSAPIDRIPVFVRAEAADEIPYLFAGGAELEIPSPFSGGGGGGGRLPAAPTARTTVTCASDRIPPGRGNGLHLPRREVVPCRSWTRTSGLETPAGSVRSLPLPA